MSILGFFRGLFRAQSHFEKLRVKVARREAFKKEHFFDVPSLSVLDDETGDHFTVKVAVEFYMDKSPLNQKLLDKIANEIDGQLTLEDVKAVFHGLLIEKLKPNKQVTRISGKTVANTTIIYNRSTVEAVGDLNNIIEKKELWKRLERFFTA